MSVSMFIPETNPAIGVSGSTVKPITTGNEVNIVPKAKSFTDNIFSALDDIGSTLTEGVSTAVSSIVQSEVDGLNTGPESAVTREGDPFDQPGRTETVDNVPFYKMYQKQLTIGGVALIGAIGLYFALRK